MTVDIRGTAEVPPTAVKSIAIRADIDGLEMQECNSEIAYASKTKYAHMCGHDGHTATLILAAYLIWSARHTFSNQSLVRLLFQPAEEGPGGAEPMIKDGCLEGIEEVYGLHNIPCFPEGEIRVKSGAMMAGFSGLKVTIKGKGGHSSTPEKARDAVGAAAALVGNLHLVKQRFLSAAEGLVLSITQIHGGNCNNVFPDEAFIDGGLRFYSNRAFKVAMEKITEIANHTAEIYGCTADVSFYEKYPALINSDV